MRKLFCVLIVLMPFLCAGAQTVMSDKSLCGGTSALLTVSGVTFNDAFVCAPADIPFFISTWEDNPAGTTY